MELVLAEQVRMPWVSLLKITLLCHWACGICRVRIQLVHKILTVSARNRWQSLFHAKVQPAKTNIMERSRPRLGDCRVTGRGCGHTDSETGNRLRTLCCALPGFPAVPAVIARQPQARRYPPAPRQWPLWHRVFRCGPGQSWQY